MSCSSPLLRIFHGRLIMLALLRPYMFLPFRSLPLAPGVHITLLRLLRNAWTNEKNKLKDLFDRIVRHPTCLFLPQVQELHPAFHGSTPYGVIIGYGTLKRRGYLPSLAFMVRSPTIGSQFPLEKT